MSKHSDQRKERFKKRCALLLLNRKQGSQKYVKARKESKMSSGELLIAKFLQENNVRFIREYHTNYLYNWKTQRLLFFDFFLPDQKAAIEFDGPHHYRSNGDEEKFRAIVYKDKRKNKYCDKHGIKLLRIPYWQGSKIPEIICKWFDDNF